MHRLGEVLPLGHIGELLADRRARRSGEAPQECGDLATGNEAVGREQVVADARGDRFKNTDKDLLNNGDILSLTKPDVIGDIHKRFLSPAIDE